MYALAAEKLLVVDDRDRYLSSRDNILERSWETELWMRVIQKAIDDLALYRRMHADGEELSEEDVLYADTAYSFLFNPEYTIMIGTMELTLEELLAMWGCENITTWRERVRKKVQVLEQEKRKAILARRSRNEGEKNG
jgi:hypothetical protein